MAIMGKPVWAVMCGAIRSDFELYTALAQLCEYRSCGLLDGIVISTWKGEVDRLPNLRKKLNELDIYLIELDPVDEDLGKFCNLNFARQAYQLKNGLDFVPEDVFVLKCRTDHNGHLIQKFVNYVLQKNVDLSIGVHGAWHTNLNYRIAVYYSPLFWVFWMLDRVFLGYKPDLYRMISFDNVVVKYGCDIPPDMAFFFNAFLGEYPLLGEIWQLTRRTKLFFEGRPILRGLQAFYAQADQKKEDFELPEALNKFFALYFVILENCFYPTNVYKKKIKPFYIADVFLTNTSIGMSNSGRPSLFVNIEILYMIINGKCLPTKGYIKLYNEINKLKDPKYAYKMHITRDDYKEMNIWIKNILKIDPGKVLEWTDPAPSQRKDLDFSKSLDILYSDHPSVVNNSDTFHAIMKNICFCSKIPFHKSLINNYKYLKKIDRDIYDSSIMALSRNELPYIYKFIAKELYNKRFSNTRENDYVFIFKRFEQTSLFYKLPMLPEMYAALYYYGKYAEEHGNTYTAKRFHNFLMKWANDTVCPEQKSYADASLVLIKKIVSKRYREYRDNIQIQYMIDFLLDEFGEFAFTSDAAEFLGEYLAERTYGRPFMLGQPDAYTLLLQGAQTARNSNVKSILRLLLREMSSQPEEIREKAKKTLAELKNRFSLPDSSLLYAAMLTEGDPIPFQTDDIKTEEDFVLFLRLLCMNGCISKNRAKLMALCGDIAFRRFALAFFERLENRPEIRFFTVRPTPEGLSLWIYYKNFMETGYDNRLVPDFDAQGLPWPFADAASPSKFAAFLRWEQVKNRIGYSIEVYASKNKEKDQLLLLMQQKRPMYIDLDDRCIKLERKNLTVNRLEDISSAVNSALDSFCEIGEHLTACAQKL